MRRTVRSLPVAVRVVDEDVLDVAGVVDEDDGGAHEAVLGDVAEGLVKVFEEARWGGLYFYPGAGGRRRSSG